MALMDILVVEDAPEYAQLVVKLLRDRGHSVRIATTIAEASDLLNANQPDLVVLDLTLPDGDGLELCRIIRERSNAYIVILSGRDEEFDKVLGLRLGADDYITKPFSPREFEARIDAIARRPRAAVADVSERVFGDLVIRPLAREVEVSGVAIELTRFEFDLLDTLASNPQQVFSRVQLLEGVRGEQWFGDDHVVDVHIANLRKKLRVHTDQAVVRTVRGVGYSFASTNTRQ